MNAPDLSGPVLVVALGLGAKPASVQWLVDALPVRAVVVPLGGEVDVASLRGRVVVLGISAGCLTALRLCRSATVERLVLVEPFLRPGRVWALRALLRRMGVDRNPEQRAWVERQLGVFSDADFTGLLDDLPAQTDVLVGDELLEPMRRDLRRFPSLTSEDERALWRSRPGVRLHVCRGSGHNVPAEAREALLSVVREAVDCVRVGG